MKLLLRTFFLLVPALAAAQAIAQDSSRDSGNMRAQAEQIFALANEVRIQAGIGRLDWDPSLAQAALAHCLLMAQQGPISHQYPGEPDLSARTAQAGAHFSLIEENVAVGPSADGIHEAWMQSPGHRANLLNPKVNRVGVAVVAARGVFYAVADYSRGVEQLSASEVEAKVAALVHASGVAILRDPTMARRACATDEGIPQAPEGPMARYVMRWQAGDLDQLPKPLVDKLASGNYRAAAVGSCPSQVSGNGFSGYRVAVILY
ncbi:MAG TPA: CAP domain-containing protein [Terracidiphilus sp.]|nr:CAP domain-containing protein [Terracidiphilus sp.]